MNRNPMNDPALNRALDAHRAPALPAGLVERVTARATSAAQLPAADAWRARRGWRDRRGGWRRRPVLLGSVGAALMFGSAMAAALVSEGRIDVPRIAEPVVALFSPEPKAPPRPAPAPAAKRLAAPPELATEPSVAPAEEVRPGRAIVRAVIARRLIERADARGPVEGARMRARILRAAHRNPELARDLRLAADRPALRKALEERIESLPPERRARLRARIDRAVERREAQLGVAPQPLPVEPPQHSETDPQADQTSPAPEATTGIPQQAEAPATMRQLRRERLRELARIRAERMRRRAETVEP